MSIPENGWHPVARADDLPYRHVFHGRLHGVELALWRADDGRVNAWENRCPHRSVRLTLGVNTGEKLRCRYHGWQYRSGDGRCTFIPAATALAPPSNLRARTFAAAEANGYVWVSLAAAESETALPPTFEPLPLALRSLPFNADLAAVASGLMRYADADASAVPGSSVLLHNGAEIDLAWQAASGRRQVRFRLQPADGAKTVVHGSALFEGAGDGQALRDCNRLLETVRRQVESAGGEK